MHAHRRDTPSNERRRWSERRRPLLGTAGVSPAGGVRRCAQRPASSRPTTAVVAANRAARWPSDARRSGQRRRPLRSTTPVVAGNHGGRCSERRGPLRRTTRLVGPNGAGRCPERRTWFLRPTHRSVPKTPRLHRIPAFLRRIDPAATKQDKNRPSRAPNRRNRAASPVHATHSPGSQPEGDRPRGPGGFRASPEPLLRRLSEWRPGTYRPPRRKGSERRG